MVFKLRYLWYGLFQHLYVFRFFFWNTLYIKYIWSNFYFPTTFDFLPYSCAHLNTARSISPGKFLQFWSNEHSNSMKAVFGSNTIFGPMFPQLVESVKSVNAFEDRVLFLHFNKWIQYTGVISKCYGLLCKVAERFKVPCHILIRISLVNPIFCVV